MKKEEYSLVYKAIHGDSHAYGELIHQYNPYFYKIAFLYDDGEVETEFKITENNKSEDNNKTEQNGKNTSKENNKTSTTPKTSDLSNMVMWQVGLAVSGILFVIMLGCKIRSLRKKGRH